MLHGTYHKPRRGRPRTPPRCSHTVVVIIGPDITYSLENIPKYQFLVTTQILTRLFFLSRSISIGPKL